MYPLIHTLISVIPSTVHCHTGSSEKMGKGEENDVVLKAFIHCEGCSEQVSKCLKGFDGVEQVVVDRENQKVIVKGKKAEPLKVLKRLRKKYSKNVDIISPKLDPHNNTKESQQNKEPEQPPPLKTVILKTSMHCEGCASDVRKNLEKMKGVVSVDVNREASQVVVRGVMDATQLAQHVKNRLGKHVEVITQLEECCSCCCCRREVERTNEEQEMNNIEDVIRFSCPPPHHFSCQTFSDENVFSCSIM